jgi:hypothetical protein
MANNTPVSSINVFVGSTLTIHNVGAANEIEATGSFGTWYFDAGLPNRQKKKLPAPIDVLFLTHWHSDHYSIFLNSLNTFYNIVCPPICKSAKSLVNFVSQIKVMSFPLQHCFITPAATAAFMNSHPEVFIQRTMGSSSDPNDCGFIYSLDVTGLKAKCSFLGNTFIAAGPFILPGDASEKVIPYTGIPWAFLLIPHHGSQYSLASQASAFSANHITTPALLCSTAYSDSLCLSAKDRYSSKGSCIWESTGSNGGKNIVLSFY